MTKAQTVLIKLPDTEIFQMKLKLSLFYAYCVISTERSF